jgi:hypothetical protein
VNLSWQLPILQLQSRTLVNTYVELVMDQDSKEPFILYFYYSKVSPVGDILEQPH